MTGLIQTRPDHGAMHTGKFAAYVRVSTKVQDNENQRAAIKAYLNGDRKSTRLNSSHPSRSRMPSSA